MSSRSIKIGILGSGNMGRPLGVRFAALGYAVFFGGRNPEEAPLRAANLASKNAVTAPRHGTLSEAAAFGDVIVWTIRETDVEGVLGEEGVMGLRGKIVMDLNLRNFEEEVLRKGAMKDATLFERSMGEVLQTHLTPVGAQMVKVFTTIPMEHFALSPEKLASANAQTFLADGGGHESANAKATCRALVEELGFEAVDLGSGVLAVRMLEMMGDVMRYFLTATGKGPMTTLGFRQLPDPEFAEMAAIGERLASNYH